MKSIKLTSYLLGLVSLFASLVPGQTAQPPASSLLYEISGRDLKQPSYVFGTFHAGCATDLVPVESLSKYLSATNEMLMELDLDDPAELQSMAAGVMIAGGKTLADYLTPAQLTKVDELTKNYLGMPADAVKSVNPTMLSVLIITSPKISGCTAVPYDLKLMQAAVAEKKPVFGLERAAEQMALINSKPLAQQAKDLYEMAMDPEKSIRDFKAMVTAYRDRDADKLIDLAKTQMKKEDAAFQKKLLDERNVAWIPKIESSVRSKPTFIAVGAAHLGGKNGVVSLLRAKGYKVVPVKL